MSKSPEILERFEKSPSKVRIAVKSSRALTPLQRKNKSFLSTSSISSINKSFITNSNIHIGYSSSCMAKAMLTRAGITNMDIERIPAGNSLHYWNLVDIGDGHGWYHFDTTPRVDGNPTILLWTDAQMMEYSQAHGNCFNYDRAVYPAIP